MKKIILLLLLNFYCQAYEERTWTSTEGKTLQGEFIGFKEGRVFIMNWKTHKMIEVEYKILIKSDRKIVRKLHNIKKTKIAEPSKPSQKQKKLKTYFARNLVEFTVRILKAKFTAAKIIEEQQKFIGNYYEGTGNILSVTPYKNSTFQGYKVIVKKETFKVYNKERKQKTVDVERYEFKTKDRKIVNYKKGQLIKFKGVLKKFRCSYNLKNNNYRAIPHYQSFKGINYSIYTHSTLKVYFSGPVKIL